MSEFTLLHGDCLEQLKTLPDSSVDSLVTDPPAFIDFMGKSWDGCDILWPYLWSNDSFVKDVQRYLKKIKVERNTEELSSVEDPASTNTLQKQKTKIEPVQFVIKTSEFSKQARKGSVDLLVVTKQEVLDLLKGSLPNHIKIGEDFLSGDTENVSYVLPLLLPEIETINTVPKSVITNIKKLCHSASETLLTSMEEVRIRDVIEDRIGIELESKSTQETSAHVSTASKGSNPEKEYSVTTLSPTNNPEIIPYLTLLLCAQVATEQSKQIQRFLADNFMQCVFRESLRVMKPGAHGLVWAIPRTSHWTATALEDAGFEIRDVVTHLFGSGFPKSMDISKAIDKQAGAEREIIDVSPNWRESKRDREKFGGMEVRGENAGLLTGPPSTPEAKQWQGFGTALKPASEHWILVRKPCSEKTVAANVLKHGTGGINIDASRVGTDLIQSNAYRSKGKEGCMSLPGEASQSGNVYDSSVHKGRFPANLILSHNPDCLEMGTKKVKTSTLLTTHNLNESENSSMSGKNYARNPRQDYGSDGTETVSAFECTPGCPISELDRQSLASGMHSAGKANTLKGNKTQGNIFRNSNDVTRIGDAGGASRFFYCAKASKSDKGEGNIHPTVKSTKLMSYLISMITPPNGTCLDPFLGSGSTGVAAIQNGFKFIGIEQNQEYIQIAEKRIYHHLPKFEKQYATNATDEEKQMTIPGTER